MWRRCDMIVTPFRCVLAFQFDNTTGRHINTWLSQNLSQIAHKSSTIHTAPGRQLITPKNKRPALGWPSLRCAEHLENQGSLICITRARVNGSGSTPSSSTEHAIVCHRPSGSRKSRAGCLVRPRSRNASPRTMPSGASPPTKRPRRIRSGSVETLASRSGSTPKSATPWVAEPLQSRPNPTRTTGLFFDLGGPSGG